jgi:hypothetical protein
VSEAVGNSDQAAVAVAAAAGACFSGCRQQGRIQWRFALADRCRVASVLSETTSGAAFLGCPSQILIAKQSNACSLPSKLALSLSTRLALPAV